MLPPRVISVPDFPCPSVHPFGRVLRVCVSRAAQSPRDRETAGSCADRRSVRRTAAMLEVDAKRWEPTGVRAMLRFAQPPNLARDSAN